MSRIGQMNAAELATCVAAGDLDELEVLEVLRNPYCTAEIAATIAHNRSWLGAHLVRERLAGFPGLPLVDALNLLPTLPWLSLLHVAQLPRTPPVVRRHAERRLLERVQQMTLGEKVALARLAHRPIFQRLVTSGDLPVLTALLDNARLVENDVLLLLHQRATPRGALVAVFRHGRWGHYYSVRRALVQHPETPLPVALSLLVQLRRSDLADLVVRPGVAPEVREGARALIERHQTSAKPNDGGTISG